MTEVADQPIFVKLSISYLHGEQNEKTGHMDVVVKFQSEAKFEEMQDEMFSSSLEWFWQFIPPGSELEVIEPDSFLRPGEVTTYVDFPESFYF